MAFSFRISGILKILMVTMLVVINLQASAQEDSSPVKIPESVPEYSPEITSSNPKRGVVKTADFNIPLRFDVLGKGVDLKKMTFSYQIPPLQTDQIRFGKYEIDSKNFWVGMMSLGQADVNLSLKLSEAQKSARVFLIRFPDFFFTEGLVEFVSNTGEVIWKKKLTEKDIQTWSTQKKTYEKLLVGNSQDSKQDAKRDLIEGEFFKTQYGSLDLAELEFPTRKMTDPFRVCLTYFEDIYLTRLCSGAYELRQIKRQAELLPLKLSPVPPRVIYQGEVVALSNQFEVQPNQVFQFLAELGNGSSVEFQVLTPKFKVIEMSELTDPNQVRLLAEGSLPIQKARYINKEKISELAEFFGWQETIGEESLIWETKLDRGDSSVLIRGTGGGVFEQGFSIQRLPNESIRPYLRKNTPKGTYIDGAKLLLKRPERTTLTSTQNSIEDSSEQRVLLWNFGAKLRGRENKSSFQLKDGDNVFSVYYKMFKGFPREFSFRLGAAAATGGNYILLNEFAFNYWFEDIFGSTNYWVSQQRWGISLKAFQSITDVKINTTTGKLQTANADLKYRFSPGLWGRDETWGFLASYQTVSYDPYAAQMAGGGFFWARSMPKIFNDLFNIIPFLRYDKWVDLEYIYYPTSTLSDVTVRNLGETGAAGNWALNFHGKVLWSDRFFGEAGFGIKQYDFNQSSKVNVGRRVNFQFTSFYGSVGLGVNF